MNIDTLLRRQMELHTSVRQPPKNPQDLAQLMDTMRNYKHFFESLRDLAGRFRVEPEMVFQSFMHISVGGTVNFDRQHQDGVVPMHQAKVLPRSNAIELAPKLCKELPNPELMVYVGLSRDLRSTLRVKVEDGNDLKTAEKSVCEAVEYLNYIDHCAHRDADRRYTLYMAEDPGSLAALLSDGESSTANLSATLQETLSAIIPSMLLPTLGDDDIPLEGHLTPLPSPLSSFITEMKKQCAAASEVSSVSGGATRRLKACQVLLDWITTVPADYFAEHAESIVGTLASTLALLAAEKRSALCRAGCDILIMLMQRLSPEPVFLEDVHRGTCSTHPATFGALSLWVSSLTKGIYVTIAAISSATDAALRAVAIQSHGHPSVVKALLTALSSGAQTELRRKCLGYLALCVVAARQQRPERMRELVNLVGPAAVKYVSNGDSPSRKMARALCSVLRMLAPAASPDEGGAALRIDDERIESLVQQERPQVEPAVLGGPRELEELLFEANTFVSSIRSTFSAGSQCSLRSSMRGCGRGMSDGVGRSVPPKRNAAAVLDGGGRGSRRTLGAADAGTAGGGGLLARRSEGSAAAAAATLAATERRVHPRSPTRQDFTLHAGPHDRAAAEPLGPPRDALRRRSTSPSDGLVSMSTNTVARANANQGPSRRSSLQLGSIYDAEVYLRSPVSTPKGSAKRTAAAESPHHAVGLRRVSVANARPRESSSGGDGGGAGHVATATPGANGASRPILPKLTPAPRYASLSDRPAAKVKDGVLPPPRGVSVPGTDRLVPLSLRNHGSYEVEVRRGPLSSTASNGAVAAGASAPRISHSLRRKIEGSKGTLGS
ncbi:hypothetical protein LSCM1_03881 [Leishmania martiniquensis]|uniref:Uncharacterized protein n=1 Tax=Leishmania martiniquensis TaxID=1580590 RepID=A0A836FZZ2_9TRYP|nr:hypothetical protein LSCM1_03881 [Leishmania martiniquensis]